MTKFLAWVALLLLSCKAVAALHSVHDFNQAQTFLVLLILSIITISPMFVKQLKFGVEQ